jgi:hypothetical protein
LVGWLVGTEKQALERGNRRRRGTNIYICVGALRTVAIAVAGVVAQILAEDQIGWRRRGRRRRRRRGAWELPNVDIPDAVAVVHVVVGAAEAVAFAELARLRVVALADQVVRDQPVHVRAPHRVEA